MRRQISLIKPHMLLAQALALLLLGAMTIARPDMVNVMLQWVLIVVLACNIAMSVITMVEEHMADLRALRQSPDYDPTELVTGVPLYRRVLHGCGTFRRFLRKQERRPLIVNAGLSLMLCALLMLFPQLVIEGGVGIVVGIFSIATGAVQALYVYQLIKTRSKLRGVVLYSLLTLISVVFGLVLMVDQLIPFVEIIDVTLLAGIYLLWQGVSALARYLVAMFRWDMEHQKVLTHVRILPPVLFTGFLPVWILDRFNRMLERNNTDHVFEKPDSPDTPPEEISETRLMILFHLGRHVAYGYGHVDIALGDTVYSYGCYDDSSNRMNGIFSDGTFMVTDLQKYLDYCRVWQRKMVVSFTMQLTVEQERRVRAALDDILSQCTPWRPGEKNSTAIGKARHASSMFEINYFKVPRGPFKLYSVLRTNCVAMAEIIVGQTGLKILPSYGIVTPGSYYVFLERQLKDPGSPIICQTLYKINGKLPGKAGRM